MFNLQSRKETLFRFNMLFVTTIVHWYSCIYSHVFVLFFFHLTLNYLVSHFSSLLSDGCSESYFGPLVSSSIAYCSVLTPFSKLEQFILLCDIYLLFLLLILLFSVFFHLILVCSIYIESAPSFPVSVEYYEIHLDRMKQL